MKIKCIKFTEIGDKCFLSLEKEYLVLEISVIDGIVKCCIICDDCRPASFSIDKFEIVDNRIPTNWVVRYTINGQLWFSPSRWLDDNLWQYSFWEDYYGDENEKAERIFEEEVQKMIEESEGPKSN